MGAETTIEWTDATWTPVRARSRTPLRKVGWHCEHVSEGCRNCYAERLNIRLGTGLAFKPGRRNDVEMYLDEKMLTAPLRWRKPRMVFVCSMTDLFADFVKDEWIDRMFAVMALCPQHTFQILTKRPERMRRYFATAERNFVIALDPLDHAQPRNEPWSDRVCTAQATARIAARDRLLRHWPLPNVWLGTSCEDQETADARVPHLLQTPAALRFLSCEPMLGPIDLEGIAHENGEKHHYYHALAGYVVDGTQSQVEKIDWVIVGGESGPNARPMLAEPVIVNGRKNNTPRRPSTDPIPTLDTKGAVWLAEPFILSRHAEGAPRSLADPTPTQVAKQSHILISPYYGSGSGETCKSAEQPLDTVTSKARFGMVVPVTHSKGGNGARNVDDPIPTMTTAKGGEFALVMPLTHAGGLDRAQDDNVPLPTITGANRGELAFITAQHGEREGQSPHVHSIDDPAPTVAAQGHVDLAQGVVEPVFDGERYDILFRMLEPHELAAAMGFTTEDQPYEFAGTKTEQVRQIGNAVSVAMMKAEVKAIMADAASKMRRRSAGAREPKPEARAA